MQHGITTNAALAASLTILQLLLVGAAGLMTSMIARLYNKVEVLPAITEVQRRQDVEIDRLHRMIDVLYARTRDMDDPDARP